MRIQVRLEELKALRDGWLDGRGLAPSASGLEWLAKEFEARYPEELPQPYIYPEAEGGVRLEWSLGPQEVSLDMDLARKAGNWHTLNLETDEEESKTLDLGDEAGWDWLTGRLAALDGVPSRD